MKKYQEDIIKTHVLNLDEIREAEKKDKRNKNKKIIAITSIVGIFLIVLGILYPFITDKILKKEEPKKKQKSKEILTCTSNFENKVLNINISVQKTYNFKKNKLFSSTNKTIFRSKNNDQLSINKLYQRYNQLYLENKTLGVIYNINYKETELTIIEVIDDYNKINIEEYDTTLNTDSKTLIYSTKHNYEDIKKQSEQLGALCN